MDNTCYSASKMCKLLHNINIDLTLVNFWLFKTWTERVWLFTTTPLTLTDAKALPSVSPVCEPDVGTLELWEARWKMRKGKYDKQQGINTPTTIYYTSKRRKEINKNKQQPQQIKSIYFALYLILYSMLDITMKQSLSSICYNPSIIYLLPISNVVSKGQSHHMWVYHKIIPSLGARTSYQNAENVFLPL